MSVGLEQDGDELHTSSQPAFALYQAHEMQAVVRSDAMVKLMRMVERVARHTAAVLITGETGTGKELIARAIHHHSLRCGQPWVDINCAALPENLIESELFGYEKGAFSGANNSKPGLFELAHQGTLFLDEIGELEPKIQVKLLRVLDGVPYYRLGGSRKISVDVRIVAATNQELQTAVAEGKFRSDLYHRLSHFHLKVPPLRERPDDIVALSEYFLSSARPGARFTPEALDYLRSCPWQGNVRELRNVVVRTAALTDDREIQASEIFMEGSSTVMPAMPVHTVTAAPAPSAPHTDLGEVEKITILRTLAGTGGHQGKAAELLGISRRTLTRKLKQYQIPAEERRSKMSLGSLSPAQQTNFRAEIALPVTICTIAGEEIQAEAVNISMGGMALQSCEKSFALSEELRIRFTLPDTGIEVKARGRVAWADLSRKIGIRFLDVLQESRSHLQEWLARRMKEEGWDRESVYSVAQS